MKDFSEKMRLAAQIIEDNLEFEYLICKEWKPFVCDYKQTRMETLIDFIKRSIEFRIK